MSAEFVWRITASTVRCLLWQPHDPNGICKEASNALLQRSIRADGHSGELRRDFSQRTHARYV
jgi:hypothetical protein